MAAVGKDKLLRRILGGAGDASIRFDDLCQLLESLGFQTRVHGSHHVFRKEGVDGMINLQRSGSNAKVYQVKQVRKILKAAGMDDQQ